MIPSTPIEPASSTAITERFPRTVTCAWCGNHYRSVFLGTPDQGLQGSHCASDVVQEGGQWLVRGGYGSDEHDMHRYLFVANPPSAPADPVCDECISQRWHGGDLQDRGLEADRRPSDFSPRPSQTWGLVQQIRELVEREVALRRVVEAACREHAEQHEGTACEVCAMIREYRKHQRWTGEVDDGGAKYTEGCREIAEQLREAASSLQDLAAFWERRAPKAQSHEMSNNGATLPSVGSSERRDPKLLKLLDAARAAVEDSGPRFREDTLEGLEVAARAWAVDECSICGRRGDHEWDELTHAQRTAHEANNQ